MVPFNADWRWLLGREDSIWYPTMRLFRQQQPQSWPDVVQRLCVDVQKLISGDKSVLQPRPWVGAALTRHPHAISLPDIEKTFS